MSELPQGWVNAALDDIAIVNPGRIEGLVADTSVSFVPMPAVSDVDGEIINPTIRPFAEVSKGYTQFQEGDVIFAKITPCMENGKIAVARSLENGVACGSTEFHVVRPLGESSPDYVWRFLRQKSYRNDAEASMTGAVGQRRVPAAHLKESQVPVPPLPEQRRIVARIDSLTGKSRRARDHLDHIPRLVEKYKQAVLAAAFRGDLTREWRTSSVLTDAVWNAAELGKIADVGTGATPKRGTSRYYDGGTIRWVTSGAVNDEVVSHSEQCITPAALRETNCQLYPVGTLLLAMYGEGKTRGKVAVLGIEAATNQALAAIVVHRNGPAERDFVLWYLRSQYLELREQAAGGVQPNLNLGIVKRTRLPLPSQIEQREIVQRLETAFAWIDRLASEATSARRLIDRLDQAVLAKAFRGELVPQDPADEPANVLLDRIRAERGAVPKAKRGRSAS